MAAQVHTWWLGGEKNPAAAKAGVALNKEFANIQASPEEVKAALLVHQAGKSSFATFYERLTKGGWTRDGVSAEDELAEIEREEPMREEPPDDEMPPEAE
jgi:hypothetical protein